MNCGKVAGIIMTAVGGAALGAGVVTFLKSGKDRDAESFHECDGCCDCQKETENTPIDTADFE